MYPSSATTYTQPHVQPAKATENLFDTVLAHRVTVAAKRLESEVTALYVLAQAKVPPVMRITILRYANANTKIAEFIFKEFVASLQQQHEALAKESERLTKQQNELWKKNPSDQSIHIKIKRIEVLSRVLEMDIKYAKAMQAHHYEPLAILEQICNRVRTDISQLSVKELEVALKHIPDLYRKTILSWLNAEADQTRHPRTLLPDLPSLFTPDLYIALSYLLTDDQIQQSFDANFLEFANRLSRNKKMNRLKQFMLTPEFLLTPPPKQADFVRMWFKQSVFTSLHVNRINLMSLNPNTKSLTRLSWEMVEVLDILQPETLLLSRHEIRVLPVKCSTLPESGNFDFSNNCRVSSKATAHKIV